MLRFFVALLLIAEGMTYDCSRRHHCIPDEEIPDSFPETEEELQKICRPLIEHTRCETLFAENCLDGEPERIQLAYRIMATLEEICSPDTLLHAAIVQNLKCLKSIFDDEDNMHYCSMRARSDELQQIVEGLSEEGLVSLPDDESDTEKLHNCVNLMNFFACQSVQLEQECGEVGMETYAEIIRKIDPLQVLDCEFSFDILPAVIHLYKLGQEKESSIVEDLTDD